MNVFDSRFPTGKTERTFMPTFTINTDNNITAFSSLKEIEGSGAGTETFRSAEELAGLAKD
jgi:hypothetical protein